MGMLKDLDQDQKMLRLEKRIRKLESQVNGGNKMSKILETLVGQDVIMNIGYEEIRCRVLDVDDDWIKMLIYGKKRDKDMTVIRPVYEISKVTLDKEGV